MFVLRITCIDKLGIVAAVAGGLADSGCNIEESSQFFDPHSGRFFMRVVFRALETDAQNTFAKAMDGIARRFDMDYQICDLDIPVRTMVMVSKADHCLHDLLYHVRTKTLPIDITAIVSNHDDMKPLSDAAKIPFHKININENKKIHEDIIESIAAQSNTELILLARYMQIFSDDFCAKHAQHTINIHHSFLPGFKGAKPYHQAYERGVKIIGATAHFATSDLDEGPIIVQDIEPVDHRHFPDKMQAMGRDIESRVLTRATELFCERRIFLNGRRTVIL